MHRMTLFSFRLFRKNLGNLREFFGQMVHLLPPPPLPWQKIARTPMLSEVNFADRKNALTEKQKVQKKILPFATQFQLLRPCLKNILMDKWHLIQNQPLRREIYKEPPLISYRKGKSLKDMLVKAKL